MSKRTAPNFKEWFEVFPAGTHTDSVGKTKTWTEADIDQMVANFNANDKVPFVIGHPKSNAPAWGWSELKRDGKKLMAKASEVHSTFQKWADEGHIRNRSVKIVATPKGYKVAHIGFLGAAAPAIEGMESLYSANDEGEVFEFGMDPGWAFLSGLRALGRSLRLLRETTIEEKGIEAADKAVPLWPIEQAESAAADMETRLRAADNLFTANEPEVTSVPANTPKTFTQDEMDAALAAEREKTQAAEAKAHKSEFAARLADNKTFISGLISDKEGKVRLLPAEAEGWAEALTFCQEQEGQEFTFSAADGSEQKPKLYEFLKAKLSGRTVQMQLGKEHVTGEDRVDLNDANAIQQAASEYMHEQAEKGVTINIAQAVDHVKQRSQR